jgi:hypothetical protein
MNGQNFDSLDAWLAAHASGRLPGRGARGGMKKVRRAEVRREAEIHHREQAEAQKKAAESQRGGVYRREIADTLRAEALGVPVGTMWYLVKDYHGNMVASFFGPVDQREELTVIAWEWFEEHVRPPETWEEPVDR